MDGGVMAGRPKNKALARTARKGQRLFQGRGSWPDAAEALAALTRAWTVTMVASALLAGALAIAPFWDTAIYLRALQDTVDGNPALTLPGDGTGHPRAGFNVTQGP
jgi:hypothetical protein